MNIFSQVDRSEGTTESSLSVDSSENLHSGHLSSDDDSCYENEMFEQFAHPSLGHFRANSTTGAKPGACFSHCQKEAVPRASVDELLDILERYALAHAYANVNPQSPLSLPLSLPLSRYILTRSKPVSSSSIIIIIPHPTITQAWT